MTPQYEDAAVALYADDCLDVLRELADASVDAVVTDPPYELGFMGKGWDSTGIAYNVDLWREAFRVLKPGGHLLAFGGTRTWHRLACAVEDAGFEVRDSIAWLYGSGFPKSLDVSKAIDKAAGAEREVGRPGPYSARRPRVDVAATNAYADGVGDYGSSLVTAPATPDAERWQGWGTALKPAFEPVVVARKPLVGTVAANVLAHGTGALNVDACRIGDEGGARHEPGTGGFDAGTVSALGGHLNSTRSPAVAGLGRWPANVVLDEDQADALDQQSGTLTSGANPTRRGSDGDRQAYGAFTGQADANPQRGVDTGGASRFFYTAKAGSSERPSVDGIAHPTVKPLDLMRWLVRLVTPPGGIVLEPFAGSGTTVEACILEGFRCVAIEREADYLPLILDRIKHPALSPMTVAGRSTRKKAAKADDLDGGLLDGLLEGLL